MSVDRGTRAPRWVAEYLAANGFPKAEKLPNGRSGADITGTPGVAFEVKTGVTWRETWLAQARKYKGRVQVLVYLPAGIGETNVSNAQAVMPMHVLMQLLKEAGYTQ